MTPRFGCARLTTNDPASYACPSWTKSRSARDTSTPCQSRRFTIFCVVRGSCWSAGMT